MRGRALVQRRDPCQAPVGKRPAACQNLVVKIDFLFHSVDRFQLVFFIHSRGRLVARIGANLAQLRTLDPLHKHLVTLVNGLEKILEGFEDVVAVGVLNRGVAKCHRQPANKRPGDILHQIVVRMPARQIDVKDSPGFAVLGLNAMQVTVRCACIESNIASEWVGRRCGSTDMICVYIFCLK